MHGLFAWTPYFVEENNMLKKSLSLALGLLMVQMIYVGPIYAQSNTKTDDASISKVKRSVAKLNAGGKNIARVKLKDGTKLKGYVSQANEDSFVITDKGGHKSTISYTEVQGVKKGGGGLKTTTKVLIGVGIATAVVITVLAVSISRSFHNFDLRGVGL
jgi:hypothetical protein